VSAKRFADNYKSALDESESEEISMRRNSEAGQTLVFVAFGMVIIGAILGLAIDMGYMRFLKRRIQTAADSAALAGAAEINYGDVAAAADADAASNGYTDGANGVTVTVNNPPLSGPHQGVAGYVEVLISKSQPTFFIRIVPGGATNSTVQTRAVAASAKNCIYTLQPSPGNLTSAGLNAPNCAVVDNGDLSASNIIASSIGVGGSAQCTGCTPTPQQGIVPAADPLAYLTAPATADCNNNLPPWTISGGTGQPPNPPPCTICIGTNVIISGNCRSNNCPGSPNVTFNPGTYGYVTICGSSNVSFNPGDYNFFSLSISDSANTTFNPGVYAFGRSGGLNMNGNATVTGTGVTFFIRESNSISIRSPRKVLLTAPTTGPYAGVLLFHDTNNTGSATMNGGNNTKFEGALYVRNPSITLNLSNIGSAAAYTIVVAGSVNMDGSNTFNSNYSSLSNVSPIREGVLVE
jgi:hypothetical protein